MDISQNLTQYIFNKIFYILLTKILEKIKFYSSYFKFYDYKKLIKKIINAIFLIINLKTIF